MLGKRGPQDIRNTLWREYAEAVRRARPKVLVMENVPALLKSGECRAFADVFSAGELTDYAIRAEVLNAADFGAAQVCKRVIVVGFHRDLEHPGHPRPTSNRKRSNVREAFGPAPGGDRTPSGPCALP